MRALHNDTLSRHLLSLAVVPPLRPLVALALLCFACTPAVDL